jgi:hypothetical protein
MPTIGEKAGRLLRRDWTDPNELAREMYEILADRATAPSDLRGDQANEQLEQAREQARRASEALARRGEFESRQEDTLTLAPIEKARSFSQAISFNQVFDADIRSSFTQRRGYEIQESAFASPNTRSQNPEDVFRYSARTDVSPIDIRTSSTIPDASLSGKRYLADEELTFKRQAPARVTRVSRSDVESQAPSRFLTKGFAGHTDDEMGSAPGTRGGEPVITQLRHHAIDKDSAGPSGVLSGEIGKVAELIEEEGDGQLYWVDLYDDPRDPEPREQVKVRILQIDNQEEIPEGTWLCGIVKRENTYDNADDEPFRYYAQVPIWLY